MKIITDQISIAELQKIAKSMFGNFVKAVVDIEKGVMVVGGELHADEEALLLENGSKQENLWGINIYPKMKNENFIEFDSMINLRPSQDNRTRNIDDPKIKEKIVQIVSTMVKQ